MIPSPNEDRPSRLLLSRLHTGELTGEERERVEAWVAVSPEAQAYLAELEAARAQVAPLDLGTLRRRAAQLDDAAPTLAAPANRLRWFVPILVAALVALVALPLLIGPPDAPYQTDVRFKGGPDLVLYRVHDGRLVPYAGEPLGAGDALDVGVRPATHREVVVVSVDGAGTVSVYWPASGVGAAPLSDAAPEARLGSVTLDGAPGPEVFVAVFGGDAVTVTEALRATWQAGGTDAVVAWGADRPDVDIRVVERK